MTLHVTVTVTNYLQLTSNATIAILIDVAALPAVQIAGASVLTVDRSQTIEIQAIGVAPTCGDGQDKTDALLYSWSVQGEWFL